MTNGKKLAQVVAENDKQKEKELTTSGSARTDYAGFVKEKHVIDICHQLEMNGYHGRIVELNHFRLPLEAILIHTDPEGRYDIKFGERKD